MSKPQHIVFLGPAHPYRGGIASFTERLAREFQSAGHQCTLITFTLQYPGFLFPGKTQFADQPAPGDLNILRRVNTLNPFNWINTGFSLRKLKPDLIIVRYWMPFFAPAFGTILRIAGFLTQTKIICIADNIIPHEKRPGDRLLTRYFNGVVDGYVVMSEQVRADFINLNIHKRSILHPHPLFDHFGEQIDQFLARQILGFQLNNSILLFFGFIRKYKGLDLLLEAMTDARIREKGYQLIIAGEFYEDEEKYRDYINRHQLSETVQIHNQFIPENRIPYYFSAADVLVQPYRHATQSGVTPLAMHFNLPMIVTNAGGLSEMVQDGVTGLVVDISPTAIANGILAYFEKGKSYYCEKLTRYKDRFSWTAMAEALLEFSTSLGDQKPK